MTVKRGRPAKKTANRKGDLYIRGADPKVVAILKDSAAIRRRTLNEELHARVMFVQRVRVLADAGGIPRSSFSDSVALALAEFGLGPLTV